MEENKAREVEETVQELIDSDISGYEISMYSGVPRSKISSLRNGNLVRKLSLETIIKMYDAATILRDVTMFKNLSNFNDVYETSDNSMFQTLAELVIYSYNLVVNEGKLFKALKNRKMVIVKYNQIQPFIQTASFRKNRFTSVSLARTGGRGLFVAVKMDDVPFGHVLKLSYDHFTDK